LLARHSPVTLKVAANGGELAPESYDRHGDHVYVREIQSSGGRVRIECEVDAAVAPDKFDPRERGIIVVSLTVE
jgi:hypothetical protein